VGGGRRAAGGGRAAAGGGRRAASSNHDGRQLSLIPEN
jgi:hypothetical protein